MPVTRKRNMLPKGIVSNIKTQLRKKYTLKENPSNREKIYTEKESAVRERYFEENLSKRKLFLKMNDFERKIW